MAVGLIGGTGIYDASLFGKVKQVKLDTPFGKTSDSVTVAEYKSKKIVIIPRHGKSHFYNPSVVPFRANIWAMKELGVTKLLSVSAVGSLKEELKPGDFVITDQFIDRTTKREQTFYETGKICHIGVAEPFCSTLREQIIEKITILGYSYHKTGTCIVIEGPRFSTIAESKLFQSWDADIINMTLVPEVVLAREAQICYANIAMVTDYDVWRGSHVSNKEVLKTMKANEEKVKKLLIEVLARVDDNLECNCNNALKNAMM